MKNDDKLTYEEKQHFADCVKAANKHTLAEIKKKIAKLPFFKYPQNKKEVNANIVMGHWSELYVIHALHPELIDKDWYINKRNMVLTKDGWVKK